MNLSSIKNFQTIIKKYISPSRINKKSVEPILTPAEHLIQMCFERSPLADVFQKQNYSQSLSGLKNYIEKRDIKDRFVSSTNPINTKTYSLMSPEDILAIRAQLEPDLIANAEYLVSISKIIKTLFDKTFGENQYTFVSIGRSLSAFAKCLEFMGVKTKQIPLSGCRGYTTNINKTVNEMIEQEGFKEYKEFLEKILQRNNNHQYVISDYAHTGKTLEVFKALLNHPKVNLGSKNDVYVGINTCLENHIAFNKEFLHDIQEFNVRLKSQQYDQYAEVKYLNFKELEKFNSALEPENLPLNRLMKFCLLDILKTY